MRRTLEFLMRHLSHLATFSYITNMHSKNLAIVWAPNLLRWGGAEPLLIFLLLRDVTLRVEVVRVFGLSTERCWSQRLQTHPPYLPLSLSEFTASPFC